MREDTEDGVKCEGMLRSVTKIGDVIRVRNIILEAGKALAE